MARDYAHKAREPERSRIPRWVYMFTFCAAAAFIGFLYYLNQVPSDGTSAETVREQLTTVLKEAAPKAAEPKAEPAEKHETIEDIKEKAEAIKQAFEFYELLENDEVAIDLPGDEIISQTDTNTDASGIGSVTQTTTSTTSTAIKPATTKTAAPDADSWIIQVASFSNVADADKVRAELILNGLFQTDIVSVDVPGKGTFHRVMVGPFDHRPSLNKAQDILAELEYQPLVKAQ